MVVLAGVALARYADQIAEATGLGRIWIGPVLLAAATSLPEAATDVAAVRFGAPDLAAGDLFGSSMANMLILGIIDLLSPRAQVLRRAALDHALSAALAIALNALAALFVLFRPTATVFGVGVETVILLLAYLAGTRAVYRHSVRARPLPHKARSHEPVRQLLTRAAVGFGVAAVAILVAAPVFAWSAQRIAEMTGLGTTFVGTLLVGFSTSLPELVASIAAVRAGALDLAVGKSVRRGIYRAVVHVPPPAVTRVRETLSRRRHFVRLETAQVNAVKRLLRGAGLGHRSRSLGTEVGWGKLCAALAGYGELREYIALHRALWRCARTQRVALEAVLTAQLAAPAFGPDLRRLQSIPGVGPIVGATILAVFSDVQRFTDAKHAASYAGLVPSTYHSGDREAYGRITKRGSGELRAMLCEAAHQASRSTHPLHPYTIAVAHRLARITFAMLRDGTDFDIGKLNVEEDPFERTIIRRYD